MIGSKRIPATLGTILVGWIVSATALGQNFVELRQDLASFNLQSQRGVPLSSTVDVPPGSDGRIPLVPPQGETDLPPSRGQFQGIFPSSGSAAPRTSAGLVGGQSLVGNAETINLPRAQSGGLSLVLSQARLGSPIISRGVSFKFGATIPVPQIDASGNPLAQGANARDYWASEPHSTNGHAGAGYYFSPHANAVFAAQAGPVDIVWRRASPEIIINGTPAGFIENVTHARVGPAFYPLLKQRYIVSVSSVKAPQKIYWTEGIFTKLGKPVTVPAGVRAVRIAYNNNFPEKVAQPYVAPTQTFVTDPNTLLQELRTLWFDHTQNTILAYNREGRVFVELLGDAKSDGTQQHLGFEVVDVFRQANPSDVTTELGDRLRAFPDGRDDSHLAPELVIQLGPSFIYQQAIPEKNRNDFYATQETQTQGDVLVHWMQEGVYGIRWPSEFVRYRHIWPADVARYSHYVRPQVGTATEAQLTAVPLPADNVPIIEYQDPLDRQRAFLTSKFEFYSFLEPSFPAHRTLLRFTSGTDVSFERVFSWLDESLKNPATFDGTIATNLTSWNPGNGSFDWGENLLDAPRVENLTVNVGDRIEAPSGELGAQGNYWAGYVLESLGDLYHPNAYVNPFTSGFDAANLGAIIPVNAVPGKNNLEVWWFRSNQADLTKGFLEVHWPGVIGRYTLQWPQNAREIVLASNDGSGGLGSLEAKGTIYRQADPTQPGYNPNEEHALMLGGQAFALRDDLNVTAGTGYSSEPFVLLDFVDADGRPRMSAFKVLREKVADGIVFDYITEAGQLLQAPMPLPFLEAPTEGNTDASRINYNKESFSQVGDVPAGFDPMVQETAHYAQFTFRDRKESFWVYRGLHAGLPALEVGTYNVNTGQFDALPRFTAVVGQPISIQLHASRRPQTLAVSSDITLPDGLAINGLEISGIPSPAAVGLTVMNLTVLDTDDQQRISSLPIEIEVVAQGAVSGQAAMVIPSPNHPGGPNIQFVNRPPYLAGDPSPNNSFTMQFYYKTQDGFDWPGVSSPVAVGSIVPYLRPLDGNGNFIGTADEKNTESLKIVYRPTWPATTPRLAAAQTLTVPTAGLPAVRGQTSLAVLYQQSIAADFPNAPPSAILHDPTRAKTFDVSSNGLNKIPAGIRTDAFQGKVYFPNLPPHLADRFFFDPARGSKGFLVFQGEFRDELFGQKYLLLNVSGTSDLLAMKNLCPAADPDKSLWDTAIDSLTTAVETFRENPAVPGTYIPEPSLTKDFGPNSLAQIADSDAAVDSYALSASGPGFGYITLIAGNGKAFTPAGDPVSLYVIRADAPLFNGEVKVLPSANPLNEFVTLQHTGDLAAQTQDYEYDWRIAPPVDGFPVPLSSNMTGWQPLASGTDIPRHVLGGAGIQALVDNYVTMRYRPINPAHPLFAANPQTSDWSDWSRPALVEGWIKRVLAGINPFNQRVTDLFSNSVNTDASILTQAGKRWEGNVALNLESINQFGLIEIYETVLRRGKGLSIDAGINFGPANDALLLAAGYLNDLYMFHGNEAFVDSENPTIGISTADGMFGELATSLFAFKGQFPTLLEEELGLLRGRDDFFLPGTEISPVYNRMVWNYTRGIDSGEIIYALNYNILDQDQDGVVGPADAAHLFPQGHGDAYGHFLTALKGYYSLLINPNFDWVPRIEAVSILGQPVSVDYQDERKFASSAVSLARTGRQVFDLSWHQDYQVSHGIGWDHMSATRTNTQTQRTRHWGPDHWASRTGQGAYLNWMIGNAILPDVDPDPTHEGIQKVDRTTVLELQELPVIAEALQTDLDNAEAGLTPLGLPESSVPFDLNPDVINSSERRTHFEQVMDRAKAALNNAVAAFDEAKDVTRLMRSEQDSLDEFRAGILSQELSYTNSLISIYGTPYTDDIGPGKTYKQGYNGPDLLHYMYVETVERPFNGLAGVGHSNIVHQLDLQDLSSTWWTNIVNLPVAEIDSLVPWSDPRFANDANLSVSFNLDAHGFSKPSQWTGRRASPGELQQAASDVMLAHQNLLQAAADAEGEKIYFDKQLLLVQTQIRNYNDIRKISEGHLAAEKIVTTAKAASEVLDEITDQTGDIATAANEAIVEFLPRSIIAGVAAGGDATSAGRGTLKTIANGIQAIAEATSTARSIAFFLLESGTEIGIAADEFHQIAPKEWDSELKASVVDLAGALEGVKGMLPPLNEKLRLLDDAWRAYYALVGEGERLQLEREVWRKRSAALVQGYRTRDAAFRIFRNESLERYKALFDLAAEYTYMAAKAFDYETGLLGTPEGQRFFSRIINSRALGVVKDGEPQFAGSDSGDPGLSSVLAELAEDWLVLKSRLSFNNPDAYGTTVSLRTENFRILPSSDGDGNWADVLHRAHKRDLLTDADVRRYCLQIDSENGLPVPGLILEFGTTIQDGLNLFGRPAAAGDHGFSPASFATKIFSVGVAFEGYRGMDDPAPNTTAVSGNSPAAPAFAFLDPDALFATPYVYLIPVGTDSMRSPPLGDASQVRTWNISDVTVPMPFNIGASEFNGNRFWQSSDALSEPLFSIRKHQPFRPVSTADAFATGVFGDDGLARSRFTNTRLIGRSVWNSKWKLVIPGRTLLSDPEEGLERFIRTVKDVKLRFVTYSYSGN